MARNLDLTALRSFLAVAETGGVTRAAQRLHLTQSAVSMQLKRLEESLGVALLCREGRGVDLTRQGEELAAQARKLIALNDEIWRRMTTPVCEGEVTLGIPYDIVYPHTPIFLKRFNRDYPNVRVKLVSRASIELLEMLEKGEVDVILTTEFDVGAGGEILSRQELVWVGAPEGEAWRRRPVPVAFCRHCVFRPRAFETLEAAGLGWDWVIDTFNYEVSSASIAADLAITALMKGSAPHGLVEIEHGGALPDLPSFTVNLYVGKGPNQELAERAAAFIREAYREVDTRADRPRRVA